MLKRLAPKCKKLISEGTGEGGEGGDEHDEEDLSSKAARTLTEPTSDGASFSECLGPCDPPVDAHFEPPKVPGDGKPRLSFTSCFESGNLSMAKSDTPTSYTLLLAPDTNTVGYTQWFYYGVQGGVVGTTYHFKIINMHKPRLLFATGGMRPVVWSRKGGRAWQRGCTEVEFHPTEDRDRSGLVGHAEGKRKLQTLSFAYTFEYEEDTVFFAFHYPYTYSYLNKFLSALEAHPYATQFVRRSSLCKTLGGLPCDVVEVAEPGFHGSRAKPFAVVTSRVHPGEPNASWMMHGFLQFLCSPAPEARALRSACNWLIVPMVNPDGVVHGNYRTGLAGMDLNRQWLSPDPKLHPTIWSVKEMLRGLKTDLFLDLHGHSMKEGIFLYGGKFASGDERNIDVRLLPKLCSLASEDFNYRYCTFSVSQGKMSTARLVAFVEFGIARAYTVEASFNCGGRAAGGRKPREDLEKVPPTGPALSPPRTTSDGFAQGLPSPQGLGEVDQLLDSVLQLSRSAGGPSSARVGLGRPRAARNSMCEDHLKLFQSEGSDDEDYKQHLNFDGRKALSSGSDSGDEEECGPAAVPRPALVESTSPEDDAPDQLDARRFCPERLARAGPTMALAVSAVWQLDLPPPLAPDVHRYGPSLLDLDLEGRWPHLHHHRVNNRAAQNELAKLTMARGQDREAGDSDGGSDSNPSADERPAEELKKIHNKLLSKLRKRRPKAKKLEDPEVPPVEEEQYRVVVAFGKAVRVPIRRQSICGAMGTPGLKDSYPGAGGRRRSMPSVSRTGTKEAAVPNDAQQEDSAALAPPPSQPSPEPQPPQQPEQPQQLAVQSSQAGAGAEGRAAADGAAIRAAATVQPPRRQWTPAAATTITFPGDASVVEPGAAARNALEALVTSGVSNSSFAVQSDRPQNRKIAGPVLFSGAGGITTAVGAASLASCTLASAVGRASSSGRTRSRAMHTEEPHGINDVRAFVAVRSILSVTAGASGFPGKSRPAHAGGGGDSRMSGRCAAPLERGPPSRGAVTPQLQDLIGGTGCLAVGLAPMQPGEASSPEGSLAGAAREVLGHRRPCSARGSSTYRTRLPAGAPWLPGCAVDTGVSPSTTAALPLSVSVAVAAGAAGSTGNGMEAKEALDDARQSLAVFPAASLADVVAARPDLQIVLHIVNMRLFKGPDEALHFADVGGGRCRDAAAAPSSGAILVGGSNVGSGDETSGAASPKGRWHSSGWSSPAAGSSAAPAMDIAVASARLGLALADGNAEQLPRRLQPLSATSDEERLHQAIALRTKFQEWQAAQAQGGSMIAPSQVQPACPSSRTRMQPALSGSRSPASGAAGAAGLASGLLARAAALKQQAAQRVQVEAFADESDCSGRPVFVDDTQAQGSPRLPTSGAGTSAIAVVAALPGSTPTLSRVPAAAPSGTVRLIPSVPWSRSAGGEAPPKPSRGSHFPTRLPVWQHLA